MRILTLLLITLCAFSCKEETQEKETVHSSYHLEGGLCVGKYLNADSLNGKPEWNIRFYSCPDSLPIDTTPPTENILKYRQGGLCFYNDCNIWQGDFFTLFMKVPKGFIDSSEYYIFASKNSDSTMLYKRENAHSPSDTITFSNESGAFWEELFLTAKPLKLKNEDSTDRCNSKFCSTKDFLDPFYKIECDYGVDRKDMSCNKKGHRIDRIKPRCLTKLESLSEKHGILMHNGAFPAGDCDLGNWRYVNAGSLSKKHYEKLKEVLRR